MTANESSAQRLLAAARFAADKHRDQRRKDRAATPYINHPLAVANILAEAGVEDVEVLVAALLHDTVEDTATTAEEIADRFGEKVAQLVLEVTDDKRLPKPERKRLQVARAAGKSNGAKVIKIADKIANLQDLDDAPPQWPAQRIRAYRHWANEVICGCGGVNPVLDQKAKSLLDRAQEAQACAPSRGAQRGG